MITVCSLARLEETVERTGARHLVTLISGGTQVARPASVVADNHLFLAFNDITAPTEGLTPPGEAHVRDLIGFVRRWNLSGPIVIHCFAGISRSTAAAYITACALQPETSEEALARQLRELSPSATPNPRLVAFADGLLGREGRMSAAIAAIGRGADAFEGTPFTLDLGGPLGAPDATAPR
ncbi:tyrosine phosphatase family protein [Stappia stellulata]|uniref:tyrosine phosphatase family protein n=1 Tax=Stappia stellulata TaxID=71235 RepID=UPI000418ABC4|nr:tyrosine phosphatase family protein [Stappia stellulata]